jgi:hypothetical protein
MRPLDAASYPHCVHRGRPAALGIRFGPDTAVDGLYWRNCICPIVNTSQESCKITLDSVNDVWPGTPSFDL